jgi:hypothetical protein
MLRCGIVNPRRIERCFSLTALSSDGGEVDMETALLAYNSCLATRWQYDEGGGGWRWGWWLYRTPWWMLCNRYTIPPGCPRSQDIAKEAPGMSTVPPLCTLSTVSLLTITPSTTTVCNLLVLACIFEPSFRFIRLQNSYRLGSQPPCCRLTWSSVTWLAH